MKEKISKLEVISVKVIFTMKHRKIDSKHTNENKRHIEHGERSNISVIGISEEEWEQGDSNIWRNNPENFPKVMKDIKSQIQEVLSPKLNKYR